MAVTKLSNSGIKTGVLKYDSMLAGNPAYVPPSFESIASVTLSGSNSTSFTSIPSTYKHLQMRGQVKPTNDGYTPYINWNTSSTYGHQFLGNGSSGSDNETQFIFYMASGSGLQSSAPYAFVVDILDYASTAKNKTFRAYAGQETNTTDGQVLVASGFSNSTTALDTLTFTHSGGMTGTIALYGIRG